MQSCIALGDTLPKEPSKYTANYLKCTSIYVMTLPTTTQECIVDSATPHSILKNREYFKHIIPSNRMITTIMGEQQIEDGYGSATVVLPQGTVIKITTYNNLCSKSDTEPSELQRYSRQQPPYKYRYITRGRGTPHSISATGPDTD